MTTAPSGAMLPLRTAMDPKALLSFVLADDVFPFQLDSWPGTLRPRGKTLLFPDCFRFSPSVFPVTVMTFRSSRSRISICTRGNSAGIPEEFIHVLARRLDIREVGDFPVQPIEPLGLDSDAQLVGDRREVKEGIRRAADRRVDLHRVFKSLRREDVGRADASFGQFHDLPAGLPGKTADLGQARRSSAVPGRAIPSASDMHCMVLAVPMNWQAPRPDSRKACNCEPLGRHPSPAPRVARLSHQKAVGHVADRPGCCLRECGWRGC